MSSRLEDSAMWFAHPEYYDFIHDINVAKRQLCDGGGQSISLICGFDWNIQVLQQTDLYEWGTVRLIYKPSEDRRDLDYWPKLGPWQCHSLPIRYKLTRSLFILPGQMSLFEHQVFGCKLEFESCPFPGRRAFTGLFQMIEPIAQQSHLVFYGMVQSKISKALTLGQKPLKEINRRARKKFQLDWKPKHAMQRSQCITLWIPRLFQEFRDT